MEVIKSLPLKIIGFVNTVDIEEEIATVMHYILNNTIFQIKEINEAFFKKILYIYTRKRPFKLTNIQSNYVGKMQNNKNSLDIYRYFFSKVMPLIYLTGQFHSDIFLEYSVYLKLFYGKYFLSKFINYLSYLYRLMYTPSRIIDKKWLNGKCWILSRIVLLKITKFPRKRKYSNFQVCFN